MTIDKLLLFLLFFLPFVIFPFETSPYEKPKVIAAQAAIEAIAVLFFIKKRGFFFKKPKSLFQYSLILIFVLSTVNLAIKPTLETLFGNAIRLQGTFFLWHLLLLAFVVSKISLLAIPKVLPLSTLIFLTLTTLLMNSNIPDRFVGTFGEPNSLAAAALFIWPFAFLKNTKSLKIAAFSLTVLLLYLTKSESAYLAFIIQIILLLPQVLPKIKQSSAFIFAPTIFVFGLVLPFLAQNITIDNRLLNQSVTFENRAEIWQTSTEAGLKNPILGHGFGNTLDVIYEYSNKPLDSAHNIFLDWWLQGGIIGFATFTFLAITSLKLLAAKKMYSHLISIAGILTALSFNPASAYTLVAIWFLIGQSFVLTSARVEKFALLH